MPRQSTGQRRSRRAWARVQRGLAGFDGALAQGLDVRLNALNQALRAADPEAIALQHEALEFFLEVANDVNGSLPRVRAALEEPQPALPEPAAPVLQPVLPESPGAVDTYWISSATLAEAYAYLTQRVPGAGHEPEWMLAVTGLRQNHVRTLEHLVEVRLSSQSGAQASFDIEDFTRVAVSLYEHGQALHAIFHSHRFSGPPHPSGTDDRLQRILEEGNYPAIQAVFSDDGYVRFFARERRFAVQVYGKGVKRVDEEHYLYRIVHFGTLPHPAAAAAGARRGDGLRPLPARARG